MAIGPAATTSGGDVCFVIPTRDSARWIAPFCEAYRRIGLEPLYIYDTRSSDDTLAILRRMGARIAEYTPSAEYAEAGLLESIRAHSASKWIFRLDDDEFPSRALVHWVYSDGVKSTDPIVFFSRRELFRHGNRLVYSRAAGRSQRPDRPDFLHPLSRFFQPALLEKLEMVHTAGFKEPVFFSYAPEDAFFVHCSCLLRSPAERLSKIRLYESISPRSTWRLADEYLPELFSLDWHGAADDGLSEFEQLVRALPTPDVSDPPTMTEDERTLMTAEVARFAEQGHLKRQTYEASRNEPPAEPAKPPSTDRMTAAIDPTHTITFSSRTTPPGIELMSGLSYPELWDGRWTEGRRVTIRFLEPLPRDFAIEIEAYPFLSMHKRSVGIRVGKFRASIRMRKSEPFVYRLEVSNPGRTREVVLNIPNPVSPLSLGLSDDERELGIALSSLSIRPLHNAGEILRARARRLLSGAWADR